MQQHLPLQHGETAALFGESTLEVVVPAKKRIIKTIKMEGKCPLAMGEILFDTLEEINSNWPPRPLLDY